MPGPFPMPFYNGQIADQQPQTAGSNGGFVAPTPPQQLTPLDALSQFVQSSPSASVSQTAQAPIPTLPAVNPMPQVTDFQSAAPSGGSILGVGSGLESLIGGGPTTDKLAYQKSIGKYLHSRQKRLDTLLASADPATAALTRYRFANALADLESNGITDAAGNVTKKYSDMSQEEKLHAKDELFKSVEDTLAPGYFQGSDSTNSKAVYSPQELLGLQALMQAIISPYAAQTSKSAGLASGLAGDLASSLQSTAPGLAQYVRATGAERASQATTAAQAYVQQAQAVPALFAFQQAQQYANQNQSLQNQLAQYIAQSQQPTTAPDLTNLGSTTP